MPADHFNLERARTIKIDIPGFDPMAEVNKRNKRHARLRQERKQKEAAQLAEANRMRIQQQALEEKALAELNNATQAAAKTNHGKSPQSDQAQKDNFFLCDSNNKTA